ncbi:hypothetical protein NKR23_g6306 [Pleurostoma richardsiae]|uniref:NTF2 domain-containing protein n=1 Tax=Pleurostoma richardsiae TaxID=41990 RepID=A0AA38VSI6_9PEZI|nr:hypothetical protein NKR23_g6306 [Pleurostoma richardsiae]
MAGIIIPSEETKLRVSSEGAQSFIDWFYKDINEHRPLSAYYINGNAKYAAANLTADIVINGARLAQPSEYEALLDAQRAAPTPAPGGQGAATGKQGLRVRYDVEGWDAHVLNPNFGLACPEHVLARGPDKTGSRISMAVQVTGVVHLGSGTAARSLTFSEAFVLVPNWDAQGPKGQRGAKRWLIMSQNYRTL